jgi:hypothetical protein
MASRKMYAKDRRKLSRRRWTSTALTVGGLGALALVGWYLYRKIVADKAPEAGQVKDWSGCLEPPDWVQPQPTFPCGSKVRDSLQEEDGYITGRSWTNAGYGYGQWIYSMAGSDNQHEEANLNTA